MDGNFDDDERLVSNIDDVESPFGNVGDGESPISACPYILSIDILSMIRAILSEPNNRIRLSSSETKNCEGVFAPFSRTQSVSHCRFQASGFSPLGTINAHKKGVSTPGLLTFLLVEVPRTGVL